MKRLTALIIILLLSLGVHSQSSIIDTTCLPNNQLRNALKEVEKGRVAIAENVLLNKQVENLENRISIKDSVINIMIQRINIYYDIQESYKRDIQLYDMENKGLRANIVSLNKDLKKQKTKTTIQKIITLGVVAVGGYLLLK